MEIRQKLAYRLCMVLLGIIAGTVTGIILIPVAYAERGCFAVGGEWVLIIATPVLTAYAINKFYQRDFGFVEKRQRIERQAATQRKGVKNA